MGMSGRTSRKDEIWADNNIIICFYKIWHILLLWPLYLGLTLDLHGLGGQWLSWSSVCIYQHEKGLSDLGELKEEGNFDSLGHFSPLRLPLSKLPQVWNKRDRAGWRLPFLENTTGHSLGFLLPCPMAIPLHTLLPNGRKEGRFHFWNNFIRRHSTNEDKVTGYPLVLCFFFIKSAFYL